MRSLTIILVAIAFSRAAFADITLSPGDRITHAGERITCGGNTIPSDPNVGVAKTTECQRHGSYGNCMADRTTYFAHGVQCVSECEMFDGYEQCHFFSKCNFKPASDCFEKTSCRSFDGFFNCISAGTDLICQ